MKLMPWMMLFTLIALMINGCESSDERLAGYAERSTAEQAQQNRATAKMTQATAENQRRMVESVEKSRQDLVGLQKDLETQRGTIEQERRDLADERHREYASPSALTKLPKRLMRLGPSGSTCQPARSCSTPSIRPTKQ